MCSVPPFALDYLISFFFSFIHPIAFNLCLFSLCSSLPLWLFDFLCVSFELFWFLG